MRELNELIPEYIEESREYLGNIEDDILLMEQGNYDHELIDRISRVVRSIKGGASFLGLKNIEQLSRKIEKIFNMVRNNDLELSSQTASCIFNAIGKLKEILAAAKNNIDFDINAHLLELDTCLYGKSFPASSREIKLENEDSFVKLDEYDFEILKKQAKKVYHLQFELREIHYRNYTNPLEFFQEIEKTGDIIELKVDMELVLKNDNFSGEGIPLSIIYASILEREIVAYIFGIDENQVTELKDMAKCAKKPQNIEEMQTLEWIGKSNEDCDEEYKIKEDPGKVKVKDINEYLTFMVGNEEYGIPIIHVLEIITFREITRLPYAEEVTKGIIHFRGEIIPIYDFRSLLKFEKRTYDHETVILIATLDEKKIGFIVDRVLDTIRFTMEQITEAPKMQQIPLDCVTGIGQKEGKFVVLLEISAIINVGLREERDHEL